MQSSGTKRATQHSWMFGLALVSLVVPIAIATLDLSAERGRAGALIVGLICAVGALLGSRLQMSARIRWLSVVLASLGLLLGASLLVALIGLCGGQVLWGTCQP